LFHIQSPSGWPDWPREHDGVHTPSIECLLDARALRADARNCNSAAASITAAPRSFAAAASPVLAGYLLGVSSFGWPLVIGGSLNSLYDLLLLFMFRKVRPPEEQVLADVHGGRPPITSSIPR